MRIWPRKGTGGVGNPAEPKKGQNPTLTNLEAHQGCQVQRFNASKGGSLPLEARYKGLQNQQPAYLIGNNQLGLVSWGEIPIHSNPDENNSQLGKHIGLLL